MDGKTKALVAHITFIGWIIALILNSNEKDEFAGFYIRQTLGLYLMWLVLSWIPVVNIIAGIVVFILWLLSLIRCVQGEMKLTPVVGQYFQDWFKSI